MRWRAVHAAGETGVVDIALLCEAAGMSRQNYYKRRRVRGKLTIDQRLILELVRRERWRQPRLGARKLLSLITPELSEAGVLIGRDRLFSLLFQHDLLIARRVGGRTTFSRHGFRIYSNRARDLLPSGVHQLWVSDITYLRTREGFVYLSLIMDAYSRAIVACSIAAAVTSGDWKNGDYRSA
jgi:putative transposase